MRKREEGREGGRRGELGRIAASERVKGEARRTIAETTALIPRPMAEMMFLYHRRTERPKGGWAREEGEKKERERTKVKVSCLFFVPSSLLFALFPSCSRTHPMLFEGLEKGRLLVDEFGLGGCWWEEN